MTRACPAGVVMALLLAMFAPNATAEMSAAMARLESAEAVYASALERLREAEVELKAAREAVSRESGASAEAARQQAAAAKAQTVVKAEPAAEPAIPETPKEPGFFAWKTWTKTVAVGFNGTAGNSDYLTGHVKVTLDRSDKKIKTHLDGLYRTAQRDGDETENRVRLNFQNDWLPKPGDKWRMWVKGSYDFDEFQNWDHRASAHAGFGYDFIKEPDTTLVWRGGLGGTQTFGGSADDFRPEALLTGVDFVKKIKDNQKITAGMEFFFDLSETQEYRINSSLDYEITLDKEAGLILRTGLDHRYDSQPGGNAQSSDFDYYMSLGWKF